MSSVSEESFYGGRRKGKMPHRSSLRTSARKRRKMEDVDEGTGSDYKQKSMESDDECSEALEGGSLGEVSMEALSRHRSVSHERFLPPGILTRETVL